MTTQQDFHLQAPARKLLQQFTTEHKSKNHRTIRLEMSLNEGVPQFYCYLSGWIAPYDSNDPDRLFWGKSWAASEISFDDAIAKAYQKGLDEQQAS